MIKLSPEQWLELSTALHGFLMFEESGYLADVLQSDDSGNDCEPSDEAHLAAIIEAIGADGFKAAVLGVKGRTDEICARGNHGSMITLTAEDWDQIYYAVQATIYVIHSLQDRPFGGKPEPGYSVKGIRFLMDILVTIGPGGSDAAREGVSPCDLAAIYQDYAYRFGDDD